MTHEFAVKKHSIAKGALRVAVLMGVSASFADTSPSLAAFSYITEEYPPYNYVEQGVAKGQTVDLLKRLFNYSQTPFEYADIHSYPWIRGYNMALQTPNTVLFSTNRTPSREALFHWAGPIAIDQVTLIGHASKPLRIEELSDAIAQSLSVVVIRGDIGELSLTEAGYPETLIHHALDNQSALNMLINERVDLWAYSANVVDWIVDHEGYRPATLIPVYTLSRYPLYFAINKESDPALTEYFQTMLLELSSFDIPSPVYEDE
ncbi:substrate-binding periplasmic protein [Vreelandella sp. TE19]